MVELQLVLHAVPEAQVSPFEHARDDADEHVPAPLQVPAGVYVLGLAQVAVPHVVPEPATRHAPLPLQNPSRSHGLVGSLAHSLSGSWPVGTDAHLPLVWPVLALAHATHLPSHLASQQKPSTQKLELHSLFLPAVQAVPAAFLAAQVVPAQ